MPCKKCDLQYSSYCVDCVYVKTGLNLSDEEFDEFIEKNLNETKFIKAIVVYVRQE